MYLNLDIHGRMVNVSIYHINHARLVVRLCVILCGISIETSVNLNLSLTSTCSFPIRLIWIRFCIFFNINNANECITNKRSIFIRHMLMMLLLRVRYFHSCVFFFVASSVAAVGLFSSLMRRRYKANIYWTLCARL